MRVTVVGAGVIGLTAAIELQTAGHEVQVIAEHVGDATTSAVAGAVWFPYRAGTSPDVARWAHRTRARLAAIAADDPRAGVDVLDFYECADDDTPPWWADGLALTWTRAPVVGAPTAWRFRAPRVEPARFLPWLTQQLARPIVRARVDQVAALDGDAVIVATGLGARGLVGDAAVAGLRGQVVAVEPGTIPLDVSFTDDRGRAPIFYSIPRRDEVVLGGVSEPWPGDHAPPIDDAITARILDQCRALGWTPGAIRRVRTGLRPFRPEVRLARDPDDARVIHCYGHGGAGFTLAYGCAEDLVALLA